MKLFSMDGIEKISKISEDGIEKLINTDNSEKISEDGKTVQQVEGGLTRMEELLESIRVLLNLRHIEQLALYRIPSRDSSCSNSVPNM